LNTTNLNLPLINMDYWTTTGGLALGIPISFGLGAIVQLTRWRAAKLAQPIDNAADVDQDALKKERLARDEVKSPKTKLAVMAVCFALYMGIVCNMDRLPSSVKLGVWGAFACIATVSSNAIETKSSCSQSKASSRGHRLFTPLEALHRSPVLLRAL
jgi:hypothetical protein